MGRRRSNTIYVNTDPLHVVAIGIPGRGTCIGMPGDFTYNPNAFFVPTSGSTVNVAANTNSQLQTVNIDGQTTLASLTIAVANGWIDQQTIVIAFQMAVTAMSWTGTFQTAMPATITAGQQVKIWWSQSAGQWIQYT